MASNAAVLGRGSVDDELVLDREALSWTVDDAVEDELVACEASDVVDYGRTLVDSFVIIGYKTSTHQRCSAGKQHRLSVEGALQSE